jgi:hypothetical protein
MREEGSKWAARCGGKRQFLVNAPPWQIRGPTKACCDLLTLVFFLCAVQNDYHPSFITSPLDGIRARFGEDRVTFEPGMTDANTMNTSGFATAATAARAADVTIVVVGLDGDMEGEGHDRANTSL